jgi:hypothetical protein
MSLYVWNSHSTANGFTIDRRKSTGERSLILIPFFMFVPLSCTDKLQPMDLSVQKVVKDKMKQRFQMWYSKSLCKQLKKGININDLFVFCGFLFLLFENITAEQNCLFFRSNK